MSPLVSIIVLSYTNLDYLYECLDSIFSQSYENIELIISNDCNDGFYIETVSSYVQNNKSMNIRKTIINKNYQNYGTVKHCNTAISLSTGSYIMFIACDDVYSNNNAIKDMVTGLNNAPPDIMSIVGQTAMYDNELSELMYLYVSESTQSLINGLSPIDLFSEYLVLKPLLPAASRIFRRSVFTQFGMFDERFFLIEDWSSSLLFEKNGMKSFYLDIMCVNHRDGGVSNSKPSSDSFVHKMFKSDLIKLHSEFLNEKSKLDKTIAKEIRSRLKWHKYDYEATYIIPSIRNRVERLIYTIIVFVKYRTFSSIRKAITLRIADCFSIRKCNFPHVGFF